MRVLIQNIDSRLFYAGNARWVSRGNEALDLTQVESANEELKNLERSRIVLEYDLPGLRSEFAPRTVRGRGSAEVRGPVPCWRDRSVASGPPRCRSRSGLTGTRGPRRR